MKRPMFLTVWLVLMLLGHAYSLYSYTLGTAAIMAVLPNIPGWFFPAMLVLSLAGLAAVYLLWTWKKMGFYLAVGIAVLASLMNIVVLGTLGSVSIIGAAVGVGILYLAMKPVWKNFK